MFTANAHSPGPQAISPSTGESLDLLNVISYTSSRAGKHIHSRGYLHTCYTIRYFFKSIFAAKDSKKASPKLSSTSKKEKSDKKEVSSSSFTKLPLFSSLLSSLLLLLKREYILWVEMTRLYLRKVEILLLGWSLPFRPPY